MSHIGLFGHFHLIGYLLVYYRKFSFLVSSMLIKHQLDLLTHKHMCVYVCVCVKMQCCSSNISSFICLFEKVIFFKKENRQKPDIKMSPRHSIEENTHKYITKIYTGRFLVNLLMIAPTQLQIL